MASRPSFYIEVHKGIRSMLHDMTVRSGRVDWTDTASLASFSTTLQGGFALLSSHAETEERFIDPLLEKHAPEIAAVLGAAHEEQEVQLHELLVAVNSIDPASADARVRGQQLVVALSRVIGEMLTHMADEEEIAMPALWEKLDDAAILQVHQQIVASIPPEKMERFLRWMLPAINSAERVQMLGGMRATAPQPVFAFVRGLAASVLTPEEDAALERGLNSMMEVQR